MESTNKCTNLIDIEYDIVLDNQETGSGMGTYNAADDAIDSSTVPGMIILAPPTVS